MERKAIAAMSESERKALKTELETKMADYKSRGLSLNMARGKPNSRQLDHGMEMLDVVNSKTDCRAEDGQDCRNYGDIYGIPEAIRLFSEYMGVHEDEIVICGQSSLALLYDALVRAVLKGVLGSEKPWGAYRPPKFMPYIRNESVCPLFLYIRAACHHRQRRVYTSTVHLPVRPLIDGFQCRDQRFAALGQ